MLLLFLATMVVLIVSVDKTLGVLADATEKKKEP